MIAAYSVFKKIPLKTVEVDIEEALKIAYKYNIYAYDAYYLETAKRLKLPLLTFDGPMKKVADDMRLEIVEGKNENL
jgi:predicted nucleic acid-binding protein